MMLEKQEIILRHYREKQSLRKISRDLNLHRNTVKKYVKEYEDGIYLLDESSEDIIGQKELKYNLVEKPKYTTKNRTRRKMTEEIITEIKNSLAINKERRLSGQRKQQLKKIDIYELLKEKGYNIGYTSVCNVIRYILEETKEAFIKQKYLPGEICEFDWGTVQINTSKGIEKYQMAVFTSAYSNYRYARLFKHQDTSSFQQSHVYFIKKTKGVYKTFVYDNMKVAVKNFVGPTEKEATEGLLKLSIFYKFSFRFCNARKGNEKGHVERSVEYVRRKAFAKKDIFESLFAANTYLEKICDELNKKPIKENGNKTALELFSEEKKTLYPVTGYFECSEKYSSKVDKYSTVSYKTSRYSVPDKYVGKIITLKVYPDKVICHSDNKRICIHARLNGLYEWSIKIDHYTKTLKRKPGAIRNSLAMSQIDNRLKRIYEKYYVNREKEFIYLIEYIATTNITIKDVELIIKRLQPLRATDITIDKIKIIYERKENVKVLKVTNDEIKKMSQAHLKESMQLLPKSDSVLEDTMVVI